MSVPKNLYGFQSARTGNAYIGLATQLIPNGFGLYEYASIKLKSPLIGGNSYELSYYVNLSDKSIWYDSVQYFNSFGAVFTEMNVQTFYNGPTPYIFPLEPQIQTDRTYFYQDSLSWQKVSGTFIAKGGEEYVTIGTFDKFAEVKSNFINIDGNIEVYYFIDDVSLISLGNIEIPNVFTPNFDGINDVFVLNGNIEDGRLTILNRWGIIVYESDTDFYWDGKSNNQECSEGNYTVVFQQGQITKHSFLQLIR
jgi:gliding motility-associated-like protein